ncbi:hypothetical protein, partial [Deinococcus rubellus]|uniref:hypothetical protein n=1 Tax=Deinococcus rubellus TaxID=1889240 RepID=UPI0031EE50A4
SLEKLEKVQSTFFELRSGEVRWEPTVSHPVILPSFTSAEINNALALPGGASEDVLVLIPLNSSTPHK